jgi:hypothetical protein
MNRKFLVLLPLFTFSISLLFAQAPCPFPVWPNGAPSCETACVYCDSNSINGLQGVNAGTASSDSSGCPGIMLHNDRWYGFTAGTDTITIEIIASNCNTTDGLQAALHEGCNSDAIACDAGAVGAAAIGSQILTLSYNDFTPGWIYYLMIDGFNGCTCNYTINLIEGSLAAPLVEPAATPTGPMDLCPGATAVYTIPEAPGAGTYTWTAPAGASINSGSHTASLAASEGTTVTITFGNTMGQVCVHSGNPCHPPTAEACLPIAITDLPATNKPPDTICNQNLPYAWPEDPFLVINSPTPPEGITLSATLYSWQGCDSIVRQNIVSRDCASPTEEPYGQSLEVSLYPNPASDQILIKASDPSVAAWVDIHDLNGRLRYSGALQGSILAPCPDWPTGAYLGRLRIPGSGIVPFKVLVMR